jgi:tRNA nucleotidyltransferase (CCA-adding enzyme)
MLARSRIPYIDVNKIASYFGGGGHASAASGVIRGYSIKKAQKKIIELIKQDLKPEPAAKDIMSYPVKTIKDEATVNEARDIMSKFNIGGLPVVKGSRLVGLITRADADKAVYHGLGHSRIRGYMSKNIIVLNESASLLEIQNKIFNHDIGRIPIIKKEKIIGIVTRGDILRVLHKNLGHTVAERPIITKKKNNVKDLSNRLIKVLPADIYKLIKAISKTADKEGYRLYVAGGFIRDLILGYKNLDIDLVVEENAIEFAKILKKKFKCTLITHARFATAILIMKNGFRIDLATSRTEFYEYPAALPTVQFSNISNDLSRRDFTINAMAMGLNKDNFAKLIDIFGGEKDIKNKKIRVLHNLSFIEDPTRIFRAIKFEQRYNFKIDTQTEHLIKTAVDMDMFMKIAGERIRDELIPILSEKEPFKGIRRMQQLHELRFIHPRLNLSTAKKKTLRQVFKYINWYKTTSSEPIKEWLVYFICLLDGFSKNEIKQITTRLVISNMDREIIKWYNVNSAKAIRVLRQPARKVSISQVYRILRGSSKEALIALVAKTDNLTARSQIMRHLDTYSKIKLIVRGSDIKKMGLKPSPDYGKILNKLLYLKMDLGLRTKKQELIELNKLLNSKIR